MYMKSYTLKKNHTKQTIIIIYVWLSLIVWIIRSGCIVCIDIAIKQYISTILHFYFTFVYRAYCLTEF